MIVLNLQCAEAHAFEGWFDSVVDFDRQAKAALVACPFCGDTHVDRLPSGPRVKRSGGEISDTGQQALSQLMRALSAMARDSEDVAERFPEEARRMHYGEITPRNIRGQASLAETKEMLEEGIALLPLPFPSKEEIH